MSRQRNEGITFGDRLRAIALLWREAWRRGFKRDRVVTLNAIELPMQHGAGDRYEDVQRRRAESAKRARAIISRVRLKTADRRPTIFEAKDGDRYRRVNHHGTLMREDAHRPKGKKAVKAARRARRRGKGI